MIFATTALASDIDLTSLIPAVELEANSALYPDICSLVCQFFGDCREDPNAHGSYCKYWQEPPVCFGFYFRENGSLCYQPNDPTCPEELPARCPRPINPTCQAICNTVETCFNDPQAHGSYCKSWQSESVCFGLYYTDASRTSVCFHPNDPSCPQEFPVRCNGLL